MLRTRYHRRKWNFKWDNIILPINCVFVRQVGPVVLDTLSVRVLCCVCVCRSRRKACDNDVASRIKITVYLTCKPFLHHNCWRCAAHKTSRTHKRVAAKKRNDFIANHFRFVFSIACIPPRSLTPRGTCICGLALNENSHPTSVVLSVWNVCAAPRNELAIFVIIWFWRFIQSPSLSFIFHFHFPVGRTFSITFVLATSAPNGESAFLDNVKSNWRLWRQFRHSVAVASRPVGHSSSFDGAHGRRKRPAKRKRKNQITRTAWVTWLLPVPRLLPCVRK